jgi:hypothetical protein
MQALDWVSLAPAFIAALTKTGNISAACNRVGIGRQSAYDHRRNDAVFAALWEEALETATDYLELEARRRALKGCVRPVFYKGDECGQIREYSDTLMVFLLKAHRPSKFRDNVRLEHDGNLVVRIEYADAHDNLAAPSPGPGPDPP